MQAKYPAKVQAIRSKGLTNQPGGSIGPDGGEEAQWSLTNQEHTTGQTIWSVGVRDYAAEEEKGEKEIAYRCQPRFFMQGFFSGINKLGLTP